jgi:hypothetical protein
VTLGEVGHFGGPVVHLGVDVDRVRTVPRRQHVGVPDSLQVERLRARTRARDHEVAAELEVEGREGLVPAFCEAPDPLVGRQVRAAGAGAERDRRSVEERPVVSHVVLEELRVRLAARRLEVARRLDRRFQTLPAGALVEAVEARSRGEDDRHLVGVLHLDPAAGFRPSAPCIEDPRPGFETHPLAAGIVTVEHEPAVRTPPAFPVEQLRVFPSLVAFLEPFERPAHREAGHLTRQDDGVAAGDLGPGRGMGRRKLHGEADGPRPIGRDTEDQRLRRGAHEALASDAGPATRVGRPGDRALQAQLATVVADVAGREAQAEVAERLVGRLGAPQPVPRREGVGLGVASGAKPRHDAVEILRHVQRQVALPRLARVEAIVVEPDQLIFSAPIHHRADAAVSERKRLLPHGRRPRVPQRQLFARRKGDVRRGGGQDGATHQGQAGRRANAGREAHRRLRAPGRAALLPIQPLPRATRRRSASARGRTGTCAIRPPDSGPYVNPRCASPQP